MTRPTIAAARDSVDLSDVQGNILRGYRKTNVRHLVVQVTDAGRARTWIGATVGPDRSMAPALTSAAHWGERPPEVCFNLGITYTGMQALGVPDSAARAFSEAYREGMAARADKIGDWGDSAPECWQPWFRDRDAVHLIVTLHANAPELLDQHEKAMMSGPGGGAFRICGRNDGAAFNGDQVHFGYRDNISQPRFANISAPGKYDDQPKAPLGTVLLGYPTALEQLTWALPTPPVLGINGAFNAFRVLEQDVAGFEAFLDQAAEELLDSPVADELLPEGFEREASRSTRRSVMREVVAAKLAGRWRTGTPLALSPREPSPVPPVSDTAFDYADDAAGLKCPISSHTRRANPRNAKIVQRVANHTRRLVRRGVPYGPQYDPAKPDAVERGLLGNFICADLSAQFEAIQYDWINLGLQDPRITGSNDPLLGANQAEASWFDVVTSKGAVRLRGLPRFVRTRGGAYTFLPSASALRWIGSLT
ncbi:MAG: Dyp-type peroxidase [Acidobacteriota bacterium]